MKKEPLISVIVPVYGVEPYLDRCVESIVSQTYQNLEIILVDDGSPDNCPAMCDRWAEKDNRIKVIHKENGGLSDARNAGLSVAAGSYIAFLDSDDFAADVYIEWMLRVAQDMDCQIVACRSQDIYEGEAVDKAPVWTAPRLYNREEALFELIQGRTFRAVAWNKLYRRELLVGETYPVGRLHEDEFFTYRILDKARNLAYLDVPLHYYLQRGGSIMNSFSIKRLDALDAQLERMDYFQERYPRLFHLDKAIYCKACTAFYRAALAQRGGEGKRIRKSICAYRKKVRFKAAEWKTYSCRDNIYILLSGLCMEPFCRVLNRKERK